MARRLMGTSWSKPWQPLLLLALGTLVVHQGASSFAGAAAKEPRDKIEAGLLESLAAKSGATFWVLLREEADLSTAIGMSNEDQRGDFVYRTLREVADRSQADLRAFLDSRAAGYEPFWIVNAVRVTGDEGLLLDVAARPDVKSIHADENAMVPLQVGRDEPRGGTGPEWGLELMGAVKVWTNFNIRGAGIVVANIDTGVQYDHPALVTQYRGNLGGGSFDHNYNWYDPSKVCGNPSTVPCDNVGIGTHTMGSMVGEEGTNQIGVAPKAQWIAVKGCETTQCSKGAVLKAGQWLLAPLDLRGQNPRSDLRPDIVTVSWGVHGGDNFYLGVINSWIASGIFPAVANGDRGPNCATSRSPGDYFNSYSSGAHDINKLIANFSSRGPSTFGNHFPKPNIASPGVNVRSSFSIPPNSYVSLNGSAMGSAHVAGTVALMWEYAPMIRRVIGTTRHVLDNTAQNQPPDACGGVPDKNNAWGDGRLNAWNAVRTAGNQ